MKNIILTGFMGTGKSTVGRKLAAILGYIFVDIDSRIVEREESSINDIFSRKGERVFREIEKEVLGHVMQGQGQVVATGGGAVIAEDNRRLMRRSGFVINLTATSESLLERLAEETDRPLLRDAEKLERIEELQKERESAYADADIRIDTSGKSVEDVVREILAFLESPT